MAHQFFNFPYPILIERYSDSINVLVDFLSTQDGVVSVYQIGHIHTPGISDIDLMVVFEDNFHCDWNPLATFNKKDRYLFTHSLFGINEGSLKGLQSFSLFHNYQLLWGKEFDLNKPLNDENRITSLKRQIALEFLLANYISRSVERTFKIINVRNLLLSSHALKYDFEFLSIEGGELYDLVTTLRKWRRSWFDLEIGKSELNNWFECFYRALSSFLKDILGQNNFYFPVSKFKYSKQIGVERASDFGFRHKGFLLPPALGIIGKKYTRLNNKLNTFTFQVPYSIQMKNNILQSRFEFYDELNQYSRKYLKKFAVPGSGFSNRII